MTSPAWLAGLLAALMILVAAAAAARLARWRLLGGHAEPDADALHVLMGVAMAGMVEPRVRAAPGVIWLVVFGGAAIWFGWQAIRGRGRSGRRVRFGHPVVHAVECGAMVYMLWPAGPSVAGGRIAPSMRGMAGYTAAIAGNPALALVLAVFVLGYLLWTVDQLTSRSWTAVPATAPAPRLAAFQKITMSLAMGYMLVTML